MKPGATIRPEASTTVSAAVTSSDPGAATATIRSPRIATSAACPFAPVPSTTVPPRTSVSTLEPFEFIRFLRRQ